MDIHWASLDCLRSFSVSRSSCVAQGWINAMQSNAILVFSVDVHVEICPVARLRLSCLSRASQFSWQLCCVSLCRLTFYSCVRFSAVRSCASAQILRSFEQLCCVLLGVSPACRRGHVGGIVRRPTLDPTRVRRGHSLQPRGGEFSAGGGRGFCSIVSAVGAC